MGSEYIKTIHGMISVAQIAIGAAAILACSFIWQESNVFFQFYWSHFPAQIYIFLALFLTWIAVIGVVVLEVAGRELLENLGKIKLIIFHIVCCIMVLIAAIIDSHYLATNTADNYYYKRLITVTVFTWILVVSYIAQIVFVFLQ